MPQAAKRLREISPERQAYRERTQRMYNNALWRRNSKRFLKLNPYCVGCRPVLTRAQVVDHKQPHNGNEELFWDVDNWQGMCRRCHNAKTRKEQG